MADPLWQMDFDKKICLRVLRVVDYESALRFLKLNMAEEKFKKYPILMEFRKWEFLMSLIINSTKSLRNSKWPIEYGGQKAKNYPILKQIGISGFFEFLITNLLPYS